MSAAGTCAQRSPPSSREENSGSMAARDRSDDTLAASHRYCVDSAYTTSFAPSFGPPFFFFFLICLLPAFFAGSILFTSCLLNRKLVEKAKEGEFCQDKTGAVARAYSASADVGHGAPSISSFYQTEWFFRNLPGFLFSFLSFFSTDKAQQPTPGRNGFSKALGNLEEADDRRGLATGLDQSRRGEELFQGWQLLRASTRWGKGIAVLFVSFLASPFFFQSSPSPPRTRVRGEPPNPTRYCRP